MKRVLLAVLALAWVSASVSAPQRMTLERAAHNRHIYPLALLCVSSCMPLGARVASAVLRRIRSRRVSHKTWRDY